MVSSGAPSREGQGSGRDFRIRRCGASSEDDWGRRSYEAGGGSGGAPPPPAMTFADENGVDDEDVYTKADGIKVLYDKRDPTYWFRRLEIQMRIRNIKSQF